MIISSVILLITSLYVVVVVVSSQCTSETYSYGGSTCSSCSLGSSFLSSSLGCAPSTASTDTAFYLSGSQTEGISAFASINTPSGISYSTGVFGTSNGAMNLAHGSYISSPGTSLPSTLPSGGNVPWSSSAWVKCPLSSTNHSAVLEWGTTGDVGGGLSPGAAAIVVNGAGESATSVDLTIFASGLNQPAGIAIDSSNNLFVSDKNNGLVRKITPTNVMTTIATGLYSPLGVCVDSSGNVFVADTGNNAIKKISSDGTVVSIGSGGFLGPSCVAADAAGNVYICDSNSVKKLTPQGVISIVATGVTPRGICVDSNGNVFIADSNRDTFNTRGTIKKILPGSTSATTLVTLTSGNLNLNGIVVDSSGFLYLSLTNSVSNTNADFIYKYSSFGALIETMLINGPVGIANQATIAPGGIAMDVSGNLYISDTGRNCIKKLLAGAISTIVSPFNQPRSVSLDSSNNIIFTDSGSNVIRRVSSDGSIVSTIASGLSNPMSAIVDNSGNIYVIESTATLKKISGSSVSTIGTGWTSLQGMCFDSNYNVILLHGNTVKKVTVPENTISDLATGMNSPRACALGSSGAIIVADTDNNAVKRINTDATVDTIGSGSSPNSNVIFSKPTGVAIDSSGMIFIADSGSRRILKINSEGAASTFASKLNLLQGIAIHPSGNIIATDFINNVVCKISENFVGSHKIERSILPIFVMDSNGNFFMTSSSRNTVTKLTISGTATMYIGFNNPQSLAIDSSGNVYVANLGTNAVIKIAASDGTLSNYATGFNAPTSIAIDGSGNLYVADINNGYAVVKRVSSSGTITTILDDSIQTIKNLATDSSGNLYFWSHIISGLGLTEGFKKRSSDGTVSSVSAGYNSASSLAVDANGNLYIANYDSNSIIQIKSSGSTSVVRASMSGYSGVVVDSSGNVYVANEGSNSIYKFEPPFQSTTTLATFYCPSNDWGCQNMMNYMYGSYLSQFFPSDIDFDSSGFLFIADTVNDCISKVDSSTGTVSTYKSGFNKPRGVAIDAVGVVYVADTGNNAVKSISSDGTVNTIATGFNSPRGLTVDTSGNIYVADSGNSAVKKITPDGLVSSMSSGSVTYNGVMSTFFNGPQDVAIDSFGNLWVALMNGNGGGGILKVKADGSSSVLFDSSSAYSAVTRGSSGTVYCVTSSLIKKISSDESLSNFATFSSSQGPGVYNGGITIDSLGNVYASLVSSHQIQKFTPVGQSSQLLMGLNTPQYIAIDSSNNLFVSDKNNGLVRKITPTNVITTIASGLSSPQGVFVDLSGNVFVADTGNNAIKKISSDGTVVSIGSGFSRPSCVAVDASGNVYVGEDEISQFLYNTGSIKKITPQGLISTLATGVASRGICVDASGNVFFSQSNSISKITTSGVLTVTSGFSDIYSLAIDSLGRIFVGDYFGHIKMIFPSGRIVSVVTGLNRPYSTAVDKTGTLYFSDGNSIDKVILPDVFTSGLSSLEGISISSSGDVYLVDGKSSLKKVTPSGTITTISNSLLNPRDVDIDSSGNIYVAVQTEIKKIAVSTGTVTTIASGLSSPSFLAFHQSSGSIFFSNANSLMKISSAGTIITVSDGFSTPSGIAIDSSNNMYVADSAKGKVMKISASTGEKSTFFAGLNSPTDIVCDSTGSLWIVDTGINDYKNSYFLKKVTSDGTSSFHARQPFNRFRISLDTAGSVFLSESSINSIQKLIPSAGMISIMNADASILMPQSIDLDASGTVFLADTGSSSIKKISVSGSVSTISFGIAMPSAVTVDDITGNVFFADKITGEIGKILSGASSYSTFASGFSQPAFLALDGSGTLYVADVVALKKVTPSGVVSLFAFPGNYYSGISLTSSGAFVLVDSKLKKIFPDGFVTTIIGSLNSPEGLVIDSVGNCYFMDTQGLKMVSLDGSTTSVVSSSFSTNGLHALSVHNGNLFVAEGANNAIIKVMFKLHFPVCGDFLWHHIAQVYEPELLRMSAYLDGKLLLQRPALVKLPAMSASSLRIGWSGENGRKSLYSGSLADLRIYGRALSLGEVEILSLPSSGLFPNERLQSVVSMSPDGKAFWFSCANGAAGPIATLSKTLTNSYSWTSSPSCLQCSAGSWAQRGSSVCVLCPPGTYSLAGSSSCTPCPVNTYNSKVGASSLSQCLMCPAATTSTSGSTSCEKTLQIHEPLSDPSSCQLKLFPTSDLAGDRLVDFSTATETDCSRACCKNSTCLGYTFFKTLQSCTLLSNISYVVPSSFISGGVRESALWL